MALSVDIKKDFGGFQLEAAFEAGRETLALLGPSGCGKSMTLRAIAGIVTPDEGKIVLDGRVLFDSAAHINLPPQARRVGLLFQNYALFPHMTVEQNLTAALWYEPDRKVRKRKAAEAMERFYLTGLERLRPAQLSGGQQQRTALARILVSRPELLMLDEPFSALDSHLRWEVEQEVSAVIEDFGGTTLLVSHNRDEVYRLASRIAVYRDGHIDTVGEKWALFRDPVSYTGALLTGCGNLAPARVEAGRVDVPQWGLTLTAPLPDRKVAWAGIRASFLEAAEAPGENVFPYEVVKTVEDTFSYVLLIRKQGFEGTPLRWELSKEAYRALPESGLVRLPPGALMLLTE